MEFTQLAQCGSALNFSPCRTYPSSLPGFVYSGERLCSFDQVEGEAIVLESSSVALQSFYSIYPKLTLPELARLSQNQVFMNWSWNREAVFSNYGFRWNEHLQHICTVLVSTPLDFQNWVSAKSLGASELQPLISYRLPNEMLSEFAKYNFGKNDGAQILEWSVELQMKAIALPEFSTVNYLEQLRKLRYPVRAQDEAIRTSKASKLSWPKSSQAKWNFQSDSPALEFRCQWKSLSEFKKTVLALAHIETQLQNEEQNPWP
jgi:hypothetical protein